MICAAMAVLRFAFSPRKVPTICVSVNPTIGEGGRRGR